MRNLILTMALMALGNVAIAQNYQIDWWVIASGGGHSQSGSYQLDGTIGQPIAGQSSSASYRIEAGFWVGAAPLGSVCDYVVGDANGNGAFNGLDVTYGVSYFKGGPPPPYECECTPGNTWYIAGDVNASCNYNGLDITYAVSYFKGGPLPHPCANCPPGGRLSPPIPGAGPVPTSTLKSAQ
jgi:hypothetical protein